MNMNQTEFAELLNVTFATVNRWENGRALPNKLAQDKIYNLCKEYDVPADLEWAMIVAYHRGRMENKRNTFL